MSDNLRDRIADVLADEFKRQGYACEWAVLADAVISELGLQTRLAKCTINGKPDQWLRRYATDWEIVD
jgi:hypothetical protein